jgi:hypothetical protein
VRRHLYFATRTGLYKVLKTGDAKPILLSGAVNSVNSIAVNADAIYWGDSGPSLEKNGTMNRLAL